MKKHSKRSVRVILLGLAIIFLLVFPYLFSNYIIQVAVYCGIYIMLAASLNVLIGYTGIFSMGHVAFYCVGAYTSALLATRLGLPFIVCFLASGIVAGIIGGLVGFATLRLNDVFLAFTTMGLGEVIRIIIQNAKFTNGALGVAGIPLPNFFGHAMTRVEFYYMVLIIVAVVLYLIYRLVRSNTGRTLMTIRDDANAAGSLGINVFRYKMTAMILACSVAGLAGSLYATFLQYINASQLRHQRVGQHHCDGGYRRYGHDFRPRPRRGTAAGATRGDPLSGPLPSANVRRGAGCVDTVCTQGACGPQLAGHQTNRQTAGCVQG